MKTVESLFRQFPNNMTALMWAKIRHDLGGVPMPTAAELYRRAREMARQFESKNDRRNQT